jgi:hypothetical protein
MVEIPESSADSEKINRLLRISTRAGTKSDCKDWNKYPIV